jgi:CPA2 family monovalent cation:H+ antiporter-2
MEDTVQLTGMAFVIVAATLCGVAMTRLRQPAIVGYIIAGVLLGPSGLGFVTDRAQVGALAELGVLMLLYFIGMELSLRSFRITWRIGLFSTLIQIGASLAAMLAVQQYMGWPLGYAVFFGFVVALSSTAVAVKMLDDVGELRTRVGRTAISVLIAQDLAVAPMLLIVGGLSGGEFQWTVVLKVAVSVGLLIAVTAWFGSWLRRTGWLDRPQPRLRRLFRRAAGRQQCPETCRGKRRPADSEHPADGLLPVDRPVDRPQLHVGQPRAGLGFVVLCVGIQDRVEHLHPATDG